MERFGVGSIKKIFGRQREPYGFLTIHHPEELRGDEAVFYLKDVVVSTEEERRLLQGGMMVKFCFVRKPNDRMKAPCPFKAVQVKPQDPMKYTGTVAKTSDGELVVFLEILFRQVRVHQFKQTVDPGDRCTISITWKEMIRSVKENRDPIGTLVAIDKKFNSYFNNTSPTDDVCMCKQSQWLGRNYSSQNCLSTNLSDLPLIGSFCASIWSESQSQPTPPQHRRAADNENWDADWYFRTIRMAETVLSGNGKQK